MQRPGDPKTPYGEWEDQAVKTASGLWPGAQAQTRMTGIIPNYVLKEVGMGFAFNPGGPLAQGSPIPGTNGVSDDPADTDHDTETTNDGDAANPVAGTPPVAGTAPAPGAAPVATAADCAAGGTSDSTAAAPSGDLVRVPCPAGGGSIQIDTSIASNVTDLLAAAMRDGYPMCGSGYRDHQRQIELRRQHCGTSYYDIYRKSSSSCSPPTAVPGHSMHERGLAIDFTMSNDTGFDWLKAHSQEFGLKNLPSERWHYSTNGN